MKRIIRNSELINTENRIKEQSVKHPNFRERLAELVGNKEPFLWAKNVGIPGSTFDRIWNEGTIPKSDHLIRISEQCGISLNWLLMGVGPKDGSITALTASPQEGDGTQDKIPVYGTAAGSVMGSVAISDNVIDYVARPHGLRNAQHSYALYVTGISMQPLYKQGDILFLHPGRPPRSGDIVVIQTQNHKDADVISYVKEYVRRTDDGILVKQYNPEAEIVFKHDTIKEIHRVMTVNELLGVG